LKRYKAERDEIKTKMVQTVEVAVKQAQEGMQEKMEAATKQLDQARIEADHLKKKLAEEMKKLAEKENAVEVITDRFQKEREELEVAHEAAIQKYENEIRLARSKVEEQVVQNDRRVTEYEQLQKQMDRMQALHIEEVELVQQEARQEIKVQLQNKIDALQAQLASIQKEKQDLETKFNELKMQLREIQNQHDKEKLSADRRLREMQSHHRKEIDELTAELDLFEAENVENIRKLQESLKEKETVISAMGSQLAESESRCSNSSETQSLQQRRIQELEEELKKAHGEKAAREQELTDQIILREKAIGDVANELTAKAEKQFEERNELYRVLKKKFDEATSKISVLERDLRFAKKELEEVKKRHEASEADLKDELAQSKAAVAKSDANLARAEKNHRAELQRSKEELEAAKATSQQIQKSLAIVVNEKEKLAAEVVDLKNISEELMAMVEEKGLA
jgi:chromosome segregation ATPase